MRNFTNIDKIERLLKVKFVGHYRDLLSVSRDWKFTKLSPYMSINHSKFLKEFLWCERHCDFYTFSGS